MALSSNDTIDRMAQNRAQAIARDTSRTRAADARRFTLETQAADRSDRQRMEAARADRTAESARAADKPATPKPATSAPERRATTTAARQEPTRRADPPAKARTASSPSDAAAPAASAQTKPVAKAPTDTAAAEAAQTGEAEAALAGALGTASDDSDEAETATTDSSDPEPGLLLFAQPAPATRASPTAAAAGQGDATVSGVGAKGNGGAVEDIGSGETEGGDADSGTETARSGFSAALTETGALPTPSDTGLQRHGVQAAASASHTAAPQAQAAQPSPPPVPVGQVPLTIGLRSLNGSSQFEIRLDPLELGRIDVKLDIDKDRGTVSTHIVVERPETLALLQRDAGQLQQALNQAGLDASESGINLSLRGDGGNGGAETGQRDGQPRGPQRTFADASDTRTTLDAAPMRSLRGLGSLDIRI